MAAAPGNNYNPAGRPPSLSRQLTVADQAASRVARLMDRPGSIARSAVDLAERYRAGEDDLPFISTAGLRQFKGDALVHEIARRLVEKSKALLLLLGDRAGTATADNLLADIEEGALLAARAGAAGGRRRKRRGADQGQGAAKIHGDAWSEWVASAAVALDRLVPDTGTQQ
jgi:hypothetical protein